MATSSVPESSMAEFDSSCVGSDYAEIIVLRHGETAWNADRRIQTKTMHSLVQCPVLGVAATGATKLGLPYQSKKFPRKSHLKHSFLLLFFRGSYTLPKGPLEKARLLGQLDVELNDAGRQQAALLGDRLSKEPKISLIYSSDLARAYETAQIIAARCGGLKVVTDVDLRERHLGDLQGLVFRDTAKLNPKAHQAFVSHETCQEIPGGGESRDQLRQRCISSLQRIGNKHKGERVVVVSHGAVIETLDKQASPDGRSVRYVLNASVNIFHVYDDGKWIIKSWGDVSHLNQTGYLQSDFGRDEKSG